MNALTQAIKTVNSIAIANAKTRQVQGWEGERGMMEVWAEMDKAQEVELQTVQGTVTVISRFATGNCASHTRITYKLNGKRAKAADIEALFAPAKKLFSDTDRRNMSKLLGL